jgi:hypothetical protein
VQSCQIRVRDGQRLGVTAIACLTTLLSSTELWAEGPRGSAAPTLSPECVARLGRRIDERLTTIDVEAIEREVRLRHVEPIVSIGFARRHRSKSSDLRTVEVRLLRACSENSAEGSTVFLRRRGRGWRIDPGRAGYWDRSASY